MNRKTLTLIIIGAGGHGRIVAEAARASEEFLVLGFADDSPEKKGQTIDGLPVLGPWKEQSADLWIVAVGNNEYRRRIDEALRIGGRSVVTVISPRAFVSAYATVGEGTVILAGAIVQAGATIGRNVLLNAGAVVDHDANVWDHAHVRPNAVVRSFGVVGEGEVF